MKLSRTITSIALASMIAIPAFAAETGITDHGYVYKQKFMPTAVQKIDLKHTALFITDPQNDFFSKTSPIWALTSGTIKKNHTIEHLVELRKVADSMGMKSFYSPHIYTKQDYKNWKISNLNGIDKIMFQNNMFKKGTHGADFLPQLKPGPNTIVMNPHKGLSNFWTGDATIQLRQNGIDTIIMGGMAANMCIESHARDAVENGFRVIIVADAVAAAGDDAMQAALTNYEFLGNEVVTTDQIIKRLKDAKTAEDKSAK